MGIRLDVGCGLKKHSGAIGVDVRPLKGVDVVTDVRKLPFRESVFDEVILSHIVEHMLDIVDFMREIWRISKDGAKVYILTPHFSALNSYRDLTHFHHLTYESFDYFDDLTGLGRYFWFSKEVKFRIKNRYMFFEKKGKKRFWNFFMEKLANKYHVFYEKVFCWIFPADSLYFELEVVRA